MSTKRKSKKSKPIGNNPRPEKECKADLKAKLDKVVAKPKAAKPKMSKPKAVEPIHARPPVAPKPVEAKPKRVVLKPMQLTDVITVKTPNPYRNGNKSWVSFNLYRDGMTVEEALKLGIPRDWLHQGSCKASGKGLPG